MAINKSSWVICLIIIMCVPIFLYASCPTYRTIRGNIDKVNDAGLWENGSTEFFWCLTGRSSANEGTALNWFPSLDFTNLSGNWNDSGTTGCCGMWDAESFDSRTMIFSAFQDYNPSSVNHAGMYVVVLGEPQMSDYTGMDGVMENLPVPSIINFYSTGPGGHSTMTLWNGTWPFYYIRKMDGSHGKNLPLNDLCSPGGNSPCPPPIRGLRIKAITAPCSDNTCVSSAFPATGVASDWNLLVHDDIWGGIGNHTISIDNPTYCNETNAFVHIAVQLLLRNGLSPYDAVSSYYVSANSAGFYWCNNPWQHSVGEAGKPLLCNKSGSSISCTFTNGGSCTYGNNIYYGPLAEVNSYSYSGSYCSAGTGGNVTFSLPEGDFFWVIASFTLYGIRNSPEGELDNNSLDYPVEGSYGRDSNGNERPAAGLCYGMPQSFYNPCI